jgi:hypothetical protein
MTVKLLLLKSGEDIVADVKELSVEERTVGYLLTSPYIVKIINGNITNESESHLTKQVSVTFYPYIPLSEQREIPIPSDWVVTIVEPISKIIEMYDQRIAEKSKNGKSKENNQSIGIDEQCNFDQSN